MTLPNSENFNPRSPRGERLGWLKRIAEAVKFISIHAPREGSDYPLTVSVILSEIFQSTLPARGATDDCTGYRADEEISIHAPREGSDGESVV